MTEHEDFHIGDLVFGRSFQISTPRRYVLISKPDREGFVRGQKPKARGPDFRIYLIDVRRIYKL